MSAVQFFREQFKFEPTEENGGMKQIRFAESYSKHKRPWLEPDTIKREEYICGKCNSGSIGVAILKYARHVQIQIHECTDCGHQYESKHQFQHLREVEQ